VRDRASRCVTLAMLAASALATADESSARAEAQAVARGAIVFQHNCALCHGAGGEGQGRAAPLHRPPPTDLTRSAVNDAYRELIIRIGGAGVGRSPGMPPWQEELSDEQIRDLVAYLRRIAEARS
jgi:mono/diheme cytochrome c family protein